jgi:O-antigen ligase
MLKSTSSVSPLLWACIAVLVSSLALGGGTRSGFLGDGIIEIFGILLLMMAVYQSMIEPQQLGSKLETVILTLLIIIPIAQCILVPPVFWNHFPAQEIRREVFQIAGRDLGWLPLSLTPDETQMAALALIAPAGVFLGLRQLTIAQRGMVVISVIAFAVFSVFLGIAQLAGGPESSLRFFTETNSTEAVGFFANRNHFAALLYVALTFTSAWTINSFLQTLDRRTRRDLGIKPVVVFAGSAVITFLLATAQILTRSRAGIALTILALSALLVLLIFDKRNLWRRFTIIFAGAALVAILMFTAQIGLLRLFDRFSQDPLTDIRSILTRKTIEISRDFFPWGSGIGSFDNVYTMYEKPSDLLLSTYVNHAHNDLAQLWLEAGFPGITCLALFLVWFGSNVTRIMSRKRKQESFFIILQMVAALAVGLILIHSLVDYPLRTSAGTCLFALACALMTPPPGERRRRETRLTSNDYLPMA